MDAGTLERAGLLAHTLDKPDGWIDARTIVDVGAGVRPCAWYPRSIHICVEPYAPYCEVLQGGRYLVLQKNAEDGLQALRGLYLDTILLLDVIEHMTRADGLRVLALAKEMAKRQVIVFTPLGFKEQDRDVWGYGGHEWQTHKSGWEPQDFPGWRINRFSEAFFAVLDQP